MFDLSTSVAWRGRPAVGIVRAERELFRHLSARPDLDTIPVIYHDGHFRALEPEVAQALVEPTAAAPARHPLLPLPWWERAGVRGRAARSTNLCRASLVRLARRAAQWLLGALPPPARRHARQAMLHAAQAFRELAPGASRPALPDDMDLSLVVHPAQTDILLLAGLNWDVVDWPQVAVLRACGLRVVSVVYDLIPMKFPEFLSLPQDLYRNCFLHTIDSSDLIFCISASTQADLATFVAASGRAPVATEVIRLGADLPAAPDPAEIAEGVRARLARGRFALAVGTLEIRKNYALLVDLWAELLADPAFDLDLVVVGMPGWGADEVVRRLRAFGPRIVWFQRLSDAGLSWLYEHCHIVVFPSWYEGWGLPVVEALLHGRPVLASSRGATPEAGFGVATLLDPADRAGWRAALLAEAAAPRRSVVLPPGLRPTWQQAAAAVAASVQRP